MKVDLEFVASLTTPLFWTLRDSSGNERVKGGSLFFLDAGEGVFAVTAAHVVVECFNDSKSPMFVQSMIGSNGGVSLPIYLGDRWPRRYRYSHLPREPRGDAIYRSHTAYRVSENLATVPA